MPAFVSRIAGKSVEALFADQPRKRNQRAKNCRYTQRSAKKKKNTWQFPGFFFSTYIFALLLYAFWLIIICLHSSDFTYIKQFLRFFFVSLLLGCHLSAIFFFWQKYALSFRVTRMTKKTTTFITFGGKSRFGKIYLLRIFGGKRGEGNNPFSSSSCGFCWSEACK